MNVNIRPSHEKKDDILPQAHMVSDRAVNKIVRQIEKGCR